VRYRLRTAVFRETKCVPSRNSSIMGSHSLVPLTKKLCPCSEERRRNLPSPPFFLYDSNIFFDNRGGKKSSFSV